MFLKDSYNFLLVRLTDINSNTKKMIIVLVSFHYNHMLLRVSGK